MIKHTPIFETLEHESNMDQVSGPGRGLLGLKRSPLSFNSPIVSTPGAEIAYQLLQKNMFWYLLFHFNHKKPPLDSEYNPDLPSSNCMGVLRPTLTPLVKTNRMVCVSSQGLTKSFGSAWSSWSEPFPLKVYLLMTRLKMKPSLDSVYQW